MPHLQFEINRKLSEKERSLFINLVEKEFSKIMKTGTGHIAVTLRELPKNSLSLGRAKKNENVFFMNLDIRKGRSNMQKKQLVKVYMQGAEKIFGIKLKNQYVTFTSHQGDDFNLYEKSLNDWKKNDKPIK